MINLTRITGIMPMSGCFWREDFADEGFPEGGQSCHAR